jgi:hypothetical protein
MANKYLEKISSINIKPSHKGLLHKKMGLNEGSAISGNALEAEKDKAKKTGDTKLEKEVVFAENARKWHHKG